MWIFTPFGYFSVVQKPGDTFLTVRSRVATDLDALRKKYLPELSGTIAIKGTDYPFRAIISHNAFAEGLSKIALDLHYPSFKDEILAAQGPERSQVYTEVWCHLHQLEVENQPLKPRAKGPATFGKKLAYGGVVMDSDHRVLLREPYNHHGGYVLTFPKDAPKPCERPEDTAVRAVEQKTGIKARVIDQVPGLFGGELTNSTYYLMSYDGEDSKTGHGSKGVLWASRDEAEARIKMSSSVVGRARDLEVLITAYSIIQQRFPSAGKSGQDIGELEKSILACAALRFDGYAYMDKTGYDSQAALQAFIDEGRLPNSPVDQLCLFFSLQRALMKKTNKNGKNERASKQWKAFRELFLQTYGYSIPPEYHYQEYVQRWKSEYLPKINECVALVQIIHSTTAYEK